MFPGFHVLQYALLTIGRQAVKVLQPLLELLLFLLRQAPEVGIVLQSATLLIVWQLAMLI
jgi:hypothetical protein